MLSNKINLTIALSFTSIVLTACQLSPATRPVAELPPGIAGVWQSNGYGYVLDASGEYPRLFHHTPEFCIEDKDTVSVLSHYLVPKNVSFSEDGASFYFAPTLEEYPIEMRGIPKRPSTCGAQVASDPLTVFNSFTSYMTAHYAFFDLYGVDWSTTTAKLRPMIGPHTTDAELLGFFADLIEPIGDAHLTVQATIDGKQTTLDPGRSSVGTALAKIAARDNTSKDELNDRMMHQYWMSDIKGEILGGNGTTMADKWIQFGVVNKNIGYLAIAAEAGYAGKGLYFEESDLAVLRETLYTAVQTFHEASARAVIIDLSVNFGGYDFIAREIASRFATDKTLAYTKYAWDSSNHVPYEIFIEPSSGPRYTGPVVLVTSNVTVSAGEMLTMALRSLPNVTHLGEATRGAHSDVLTKTLPNGWILNLSNEIYHDHTGEFWESRGISPHVPMQIFDPENPFSGHVEAIQSIAASIDEGAFDD